MKKYFLLTTIFSLSLTPQAFASAMAPATLAATAHNAYHGASTGLAETTHSCGVYFFLIAITLYCLAALGALAYLVHRDNRW